jgi:hypothetical protein
MYCDNRENRENKNSENNSSIQKSINDRIYDRNIPSQMLQPYLSVRPVLTKYSMMPIVDPRALQDMTVPLVKQPVYNQHNVFNPGTGAPWSGYASNVNTESDLRNQIFALQKCSQSVYVPSSNSDLYNFTFTNKSTVVNQPFPDLFKNQVFNSYNPNTEGIANGIFQNCTRQQLKEYGVTHPQLDNC